jgi:dolichol-phosphate mannosyltransferase
MHRYLPALFQTYGYDVAYVPVNDRLRQAGVSKYNNLNRALVGLYDLVGVSWLRKRTRVPTVVESQPEAATVTEISQRNAPRRGEAPRLTVVDKT